MKSLRNQLVFFWGLLFTMCAALAIVMVVLYNSSAGAQIAEAQDNAKNACQGMAARYAKSLPSPAPASPQIDLLQVILQLVLIEAPHVEGGVWSASGGLIAYAYPTYEGSGAKRDIPSAEQPLIIEIAQLAARSQQAQVDVVRGNREALIVAACPLSSPDAGLAAWTMTRTYAGALAAQNSLRLGLGVLLLLALLSGLWLGAILWRGLRHVRRLEATLAQADAGGDAMPPLAPTGVLELDHIVAAFNRYQRRFEEARAHLQAAVQRQSRDQRLAALGRMTGGIAHEIRNPIAAMRLKAENALASESGDQTPALRQIIGQIDRLDGLVRSLISLVQPVTLEPADVDVREWLDERVAALENQTRAAGISIEVQCQPLEAVFDPLQLARAVDNLLQNAVRHAPRGGHVTLSATRGANRALLIRVEDNGPGVAASIEPQLFEPFATGRSDGTGLGLALAREVAYAHGGDLHYLALKPGARFELELPWRDS
ncbi:MAG: HAMP domain-containing histidine kinase [Comamonadaceae bacterium]|nr:MAG: HAMP domain-containing histidine kinase [Comamonadaceae bacterium]